MISVPHGTGDISSIWYRTLCDDIRFAYEWNGYYIIFATQIYHFPFGNPSPWQRVSESQHTQTNVAEQRRMCNLNLDRKVGSIHESTAILNLNSIFGVAPYDIIVNLILSVAVMLFKSIDPNKNICRCRFQILGKVFLRCGTFFKKFCENASSKSSTKTFKLSDYL